MFTRHYHLENKRYHLPPVVVFAKEERDLPHQITRLGKDKTQFLIRQMIAIRRTDLVLELFSGSGLSAAIIAQQLANPRQLTCIDIHYNAGERWFYDFTSNYMALAQYFKITHHSTPSFLGMDATDTGLPVNYFDIVVAADSPRTAANRFGDQKKTSGEEWGLDPTQQYATFLWASREAHRVLKKGGIFAATAPTSWVDGLQEVVIFNGMRIVKGPGKYRFRDCDDPVVYLRATK